MSYKNPYQISKVFHLQTDKPDLLQFKNSMIYPGPNAVEFIGLTFQSKQQGKEDICIYLLCEGQVEECLLIRLAYN